MDFHEWGWRLLLPITHHNKQNTHHEPKEHFFFKFNYYHSKIDSRLDHCPILHIVFYIQTWGKRKQNVKANRSNIIAKILSPTSKHF